MASGYDLLQTGTMHDGKRCTDVCGATLLGSWLSLSLLALALAMRLDPAGVCSPLFTWGNTSPRTDA